MSTLVHAPFACLPLGEIERESVKTHVLAFLQVEHIHEEDEHLLNAITLSQHCIFSGYSYTRETETGILGGANLSGSTLSPR